MARLAVTTVTQAVGQQGLGLAPQPLLPHPVDPAVDAFDEELPVDAETQHHCGSDELTRGHRGTERTAGELDDLEGPDDASPVAGQDRVAARRSRVSSLACIASAPTTSASASSPRAHDRVGGRDLEPVEGGADVESRAAHEDRPVATVTDAGDLGARRRLVARDARLLGHVQHVELVVGDAAPLGDGQLRRADVHASVELHGVGVDDLSGEPFGEVEARSDLPVAVGPTTATIGSGSAGRWSDVTALRAQPMSSSACSSASSSSWPNGSRSTPGVPGVAGLAPAVALDGLRAFLA